MQVSRSTVVYARTVLSQDGEVLPCDRWQLLEEHLLAVGRAARAFAAKFATGEWAYLAGVWHDLGKYNPDFQALLAEAAVGRPKRRVDHSTAGAVYADRMLAALANGKWADLRLLVTVPVAGHHAGLADGTLELEDRLRSGKPLLEAIAQQVPPDSVARSMCSLPPLPPQVKEAPNEEIKLRVEFLLRMIFSALIDADRLDAEAVADGVLPESDSRSRLRQTYASIAALQAALDEFIDAKVSCIDQTRMTTTERSVNDYRQSVLQACRRAASLPKGAYALDVATGGGKTLSSLSFAMRHAEHHRMDRVIVVIPFTSIIEQTAEEYRRALGSLGDNVVEHHSGVAEAFRERDDAASRDVVARRRRLATENWGAPVIVTTGVQFFESLFASTPSRCRKLHNIANSVVVLDEAQTLPPFLLHPTVWAMNELVERYGATLVLSTATQPALERPFPEVRNLRHIVSSAVVRPAPRVRVEVQQEPTDWAALAQELAGHDQVLCITHRRADARDLTRALDAALANETTVHLSAAMCAAHRSSILNDIRRRLAEDTTCRVISTQLVEAGVDLDFPVVYRSLAGIDSLVQAAGRANREGKKGERGGLLVVYRSPTQPPAGLPRTAADAANSLLQASSMRGEAPDIFQATAAREYYRRFYEMVGDKDQGVRALRAEYKYQSTAERYRFMSGPDTYVVVPHDGNGRRIVEMIRDYPERRGLRAIQRYTVLEYPQRLRQLRTAGAIEPLLPDGDEAETRAYLLIDDRLYSARFGLDTGMYQPPDPAQFVI